MEESIIKSLEIPLISVGTPQSTLSLRSKESNRNLKVKTLSVDLVSSVPLKHSAKQNLGMSFQGIKPLCISLDRMSPDDVKRYRFRSSITEEEHNTEFNHKLLGSSDMFLGDSNKQLAHFSKSNKIIKHSCLTVSKNKRIGKNNMNITLAKLKKKELKGIFSNTSSVSQLSVSVTTANKKRTFRAYTRESLTQADVSTPCIDEKTVTSKDLKIKLKPIKAAGSSDKKNWKDTATRPTVWEQMDKYRIPSYTCRTPRTGRQARSDNISKHTPDSSNASSSWTDPVCKTSLTVALTSLSPDEISGKRKHFPYNNPGTKNMKRGSTSKRYFKSSRKGNTGKKSEEPISIKLAKSVTRMCNRKTKEETSENSRNSITPLNIFLQNMSPEQIGAYSGKRASKCDVPKKEKESKPVTVKRKKTVFVEVFDSSVSPPEPKPERRRSLRLALRNSSASSDAAKKPFCSESKIVDNLKSEPRGKIKSKASKIYSAKRRIDFEGEKRSKKKRKKMDCFEYLSSPDGKLKATFKRIKPQEKSLSVHITKLSKKEIDTHCRKPKFIRTLRTRERDNIFEALSYEDINKNLKRKNYVGDNRSLQSGSSANTVQLVLNKDFDVHSSEFGVKQKSPSRKRRSVRNKMRVLDQRKKQRIQHKTDLANEMQAFLKAVDSLEVLSQCESEHGEDEINDNSSDATVPSLDENCLTAETVQVKNEIIDDVIHCVSNTTNHQKDENISNIIAELLEECDENDNNNKLYANPNILFDSTDSKDFVIPETPLRNINESSVVENSYLDSPVIPVAVVPHILDPSSSKSYIDPVFCELNEQDLVNDDLFLNTENAMNDILESIISGHGDMTRTAELNLLCESDDDE